MPSATPSPSRAIPRVESIPWIKPRVVIGHAGRVIIETVYPVGVFAVAVLVGVIVVVFAAVCIFICIIAIFGVLLTLRFAFVIIIIRALVAFFYRAGVVVIDIVAEHSLPRSAARPKN